MYHPNRSFHHGGDGAMNSPVFSSHLTTTAHKKGRNLLADWLAEQASDSQLINVDSHPQHFNTEKVIDTNATIYRRVDIEQRILDFDDTILEEGFYYFTLLTHVDICAPQQQSDNGEPCPYQVVNNRLDSILSAPDYTGQNESIILDKENLSLTPVFMNSEFCQSNVSSKVLANNIKGNHSADHAQTAFSVHKYGCK